MTATENPSNVSNTTTRVEVNESEREDYDLNEVEGHEEVNEEEPLEHKRRYIFLGFLVGLVLATLIHWLLLRPLVMGMVPDYTWQLGAFLYWGTLLVLLWPIGRYLQRKRVETNYYKPSTVEATTTDS